MTKKRADNTLMRTINRSLILRHLRTADGLSRADLAGRTGLMRSTVSSLVDELLAENVIHETGIAPSRGGRRGTLLDLNPAGGCAIGVEITSQAVLVLLADFVAQPRWQQTITLADHDPAVVIPQTEQLITEALRFNAAHDTMNPLGIGVGIAGLVDTVDGTLKVAANLGWRDIPFKTLWERQFRLPVHVGNEASIAAQGEHYLGAAMGYTDFVYLHISRTAIGAGIFINGELYQGMGGYAGEVGHMVIDPAGERCSCGKRGCWEVQLRAALKTVTGSLEQIKKQPNHPRMLPVITVLATGIANLINIFNPQLIVLGGPLGVALAPFLATIQNTTADQITVPGDSMAEIVVSQIEAKACVMGAVALILDDVLRQQAW
ncbi:MAG: ROK family transcriptional regulator [Anaerolineae bacterium]|nr:ROK family transcriptional regulator [Anaerolineae bacterium]